MTVLDRLFFGITGANSRTLRLGLILLGVVLLGLAVASLLGQLLDVPLLRDVAHNVDPGAAAAGGVGAGAGAAASHNSTGTPAPAKSGTKGPPPGQQSYYPPGHPLYGRYTVAPTVPDAPTGGGIDVGGAMRKWYGDRATK